MHQKDGERETAALDRRDFIKRLGKAGAAASIGSIPFMGSCKRSNPQGPSEQPVRVDLNFRIFNHTQGLQAEFSENNVLTGTSLSFSVAGLVSNYGIQNVDEKRIDIREANSGSNMQYSNQGTVGLIVTKEQTDIDIFLFNSAGSPLYEYMESANPWVLKLVPETRTKTVYRRDFGLTGEERVWGGEFLPEINNAGVFDQYNEVLNPSWAGFAYGNFDRRPSGGAFSYGFARCDSKGYGMGILNSLPGVVVDPSTIDIKGQVARGLGAVLEMVVGQLPDVFGQPTFETISPQGVLTQAGKDAIAYLYVKA